MVELAGIEDIETVLGRSAESSEEEARWLHYIRVISSFVCGYCDDSFEFIENDVVRYRANYYGSIVLGGGPISEVIEVTNWRTDAVISSAKFDGFDTIYDLQPIQSVDVTYSHGYSTVPDDVMGIVVDTIIGIVGLGATGPVRELTVGEVTEVYASAHGVGVSLQETVLDRYRITQRSMYLGGRPVDSSGDPILPLL